jgi:hypothetical protein
MMKLKMDKMEEAMSKKKEKDLDFINLQIGTEPQVLKQHDMSFEQDQNFSFTHDFSEEDSA